ncbi:MAG: pyridoxamine 5'-phosphate oxidase [Actinomycetota bacterium]|nr:pyridoxamine 5'-phosphate oxidase [Actinomycetota bacterium]
MKEDFSTISASISRLGREHIRPPLLESDLDPDPFIQFGMWLKEALEAGITLPNAMTLATSGANGIPSARMVLLKGFDEDGFVFYTNYESRKGQELEENPHAALVFYWSVLERQVCVGGGVTKVGRAESEEYFNARPPGSRLGAWASRQSSVIESRAVLEGELRELEKRFAEGPIPIPPYWGGYRLTPVSIEFWQARPNRLHDRFRYRRELGRPWAMERLAP